MSSLSLTVPIVFFRRSPKRARGNSSLSFDVGGVFCRGLLTGETGIALSPSPSLLFTLSLSLSCVRRFPLSSTRTRGEWDVHPPRGREEMQCPGEDQHTHQSLNTESLSNAMSVSRSKDCKRSAIKNSGRCTSHGGGLRCTFEGCTRGATNLKVRHGHISQYFKQCLTLSFLPFSEVLPLSRWVQEVQISWLRSGEHTHKLSLSSDVSLTRELLCIVLRSQSVKGTGKLRSGVSITGEGRGVRRLGTHTLMREQTCDVTCAYRNTHFRCDMLVHRNAQMCTFHGGGRPCTVRGEKTLKLLLR